MTSMLEQAVLDAEQLKEAARRNAEQFVVEKYAPDIESAVQKLLEGSEIPHQVRFGHEDLVNEIPGVKDKIKEDTKEEENKEVLKVDMKSIVPDDQIKDDDDEFINNLFESFDFEDDAIDDEEENSEEKLETVTEEKELLLDDEEEGFSEDSKDETTENEIHLTDDQVDELSKAINEEIKVNLTNIDLSGWLGSTQSEKNEAHEIADALDAVNDENRKLKKELEEAKKSKFKLEKELLSLKENVDKTVKEIKGKFDEYSTKNGILYYSNKILKSTNLSNMQKEKIVESLEKCASLKDAKLIYETLHNGVGNNKKEPKSLHEVHSKNEGIFAKPLLGENSRREGSNNNHLFDAKTIEEMQKRAGIKR